MTVIEFVNESRGWAKDRWWNSTGAILALFLAVAYFGTDDRNEYVLWVGLVVLGLHAVVSLEFFEPRQRAARLHAESIAQSYGRPVGSSNSLPSGMENPSSDRDQQRPEHHIRADFSAGGGGSLPGFGAPGPQTPPASVSEAHRPSCQLVALSY